MAGTIDEAEAAAERLEAALERIGRLKRPETPDPRATEAGARLDRLIERLRSVLGAP